MTPEQQAVVDRLMGLAEACECTFHAVVALGLERKPAHQAAKAALRTAIEQLALQAAKAQRYKALHEQLRDGVRPFHEQATAAGFDGIADAIEGAAALRSALNGLMTYFGMDEDEWSKPVFDAARDALGAAPLCLRAALASQPLVPAGLTDDDVHTLIGHGAFLSGQGQHDMPAYFMGLAERIAQAIGNRALAERCKQLAASPAVGPQEAPTYHLSRAEQETMRKALFASVKFVDGQEAPATVCCRSVPCKRPGVGPCDIPYQEAPAAEPAADALGVPASPSGSVVASLPSIPDAACTVPSEFYLSGPYEGSGNYAICEIATGRVRYVFVPQETDYGVGVSLRPDGRPL